MNYKTYHGLDTRSNLKYLIHIFILRCYQSDFKKPSTSPYTRNEWMVLISLRCYDLLIKLHQLLKSWHVSLNILYSFMYAIFHHRLDEEWWLNASPSLKKKVLNKRNLLYKDLQLYTGKIGLLGCRATCSSSQ